MENSSNRSIYKARYDGAEVRNFYFRLLRTWVILGMPLYWGLLVVRFNSRVAAMGWVACALGLILFALATWINIRKIRERFSVSYELTDCDVVIDLGHKQQRIAYDWIFAVDPVELAIPGSELRSPALRIKYQPPGKVYRHADITPAIAPEFLEELAARSGRLQRKADRLVEGDEAAEHVADTRWSSDFGL